MRVKLNPLKICKSIESEESLLEQSKIEIIYEIRALKAAIELQDKEIEVSKTNDCGQVYIDSHEIWLKPETWEKI